MDRKIEWSSLFLHSSFYCLKKDGELSTSELNLISRFQYPEIDHYHPNRKIEFKLGRLCASKACELLTGKELLSLPIGVNRNPEWPSEVKGSISHSRCWIGAAVSNDPSLLGVGIDFEVMGRTKLQIGRYIRSNADIKTHHFFNDLELLTLIFSAKESLYKALYPTVKKVFGFEEAAVIDINQSTQTFQIVLSSEISSILGYTGKTLFEGRFAIIENSCLTVLEIPL